MVAAAASVDDGDDVADDVGVSDFISTFSSAVTASMVVFLVL